MAENKNRSLKAKTLKGFWWTSLGTVTQYLIRFAVLMVLARLLEPEDFGVMAAAMVVINFSEIFSMLGVAPALIQRPVLEEDHIRTGYTLTLVLGIVLMFLLWLAAPWIALLFRMEQLTDMIKILAIVFPIHSIAAVGRALLTREMQFGILVRVQVAAYFFGYCLVSIALAASGTGVWSLVWAYLAMAMINTILICRIKPPRIQLQLDLTAARQLLSFGIGHTLTMIFNYFAMQSDNFVVGRFLGSGLLGSYNRAYQLMALPANLFGQMVERVLFPALAAIQHNIKGLSTVYLRGVAGIALLCLPLSAAALVLAPEVVYVVLGPKWSQAVIPFQILAAGILFRISYKMSDCLCNAVGAVYKRAWRQAIYAGMVVAGAMIGKEWGVGGVAVGTLVALAGNYLLTAQLSLSLLNMKWTTYFAVQWRGLIGALAIGLEMYAVAYPLRQAGMNPLLILLIAVLVMAVTVILAWRINPRAVLGEEGQWLADQVMQQVRKAQLR